MSQFSYTACSYESFSSYNPTLWVSPRSQVRPSTAFPTDEGHRPSRTLGSGSIHHWPGRWGSRRFVFSLEYDLTPLLNLPFARIWGSPPNLHSLFSALADGMMDTRPSLPPSITLGGTWTSSLKNLSRSQLRSPPPMTTPLGRATTAATLEKSPTSGVSRSTSAGWEGADTGIRTSSRSSATGTFTSGVVSCGCVQTNWAPARS